MIEALDLKEFIDREGVMLDVRSPSEYNRGRIPSAINLPLFTDEERANVGTTYTLRGQKDAISLGLKYVGPKLFDYVDQANQRINNGIAKVYCWRGGMRSSATAMLLHTTGIPSVTLRRGYKAFRRWAHEIFSRQRRYILLGGFTGCGKTSILHALKKKGEQVLDLENLAQHRGSVFGSIGSSPQPSTEQFHNEIAHKLATFDVDRHIWVEDESQLIGTCHIPEALFVQMRRAPLFVIERPLSERLEKLRKDYSNTDPMEFIHATQRIRKKLGGARTKEVISFLQDGKLQQAAELVLQYYDSAYRYGLSRRNQHIHQLYHENLTHESWATLLGTGQK